MISYSEADIGREFAQRAFYGTSHFPERRGDGVITDYLSHMAEVVEEFGQWTTDDNRAEMTADLEAYRARYAQLLRAYLSSHANVVSAFIAGPANFPAARMNKRSDWADGHRDRWLKWSRYRLDKLRRKYDPRRIARAPVSSDDPDAIDKLWAKVAEAERLQELMKIANRIVRKKLSAEERRTELVALGLSETRAAELLIPDYMGRVGFPSFALQNNNANIRRMKERIADLESKAQDVTAEVEVGEVRVVDNVEENRVQIIFPDKPSAEIRARLKSNGFHWARKWPGRPWQRQRSDFALQLAREIAEMY